MFNSYPQYEYLLAQVQLVCFMLGMGATLSGADFAGIFRSPKYLLAGFAGQYLLAPLLAVALTQWFRLEPGIAVGLVLISAMPGGPLSKVFAYLGRGNLALSISMTVIGTLGSIVSVPVLLRFLAYAHIPEEFRMPVDLVIRDVTLFLLFPLGLGMKIAQWFPERRQIFSKWCIRAGFVVVAVVITGALGSERIKPRENGWQVPLAIILFCLLTMQGAMAPFRILGWPKPDCLAVGIEVTMRNMNLALLLKSLLFPAKEDMVDPIGNGVLFVILFYAGAAMVAGVPLMLNFRRMIGKEQLITS
jgi:BASS family bile acid:Na+ symporter